MKLYFESELNENRATRIKNALYGDNTGKIKTFAILSAENPLGKESTPEENNKNTDLLKWNLKKLGIQYTKIIGSFNRKEHSFMLFNLAYNDAEFLSKKFEQLSFFFANVFSDHSEISYYEYDGNKYVKKDSSSNIENAKDFEDYFSRYHNFKFSIDMSYLKEVVNVEALSEATDNSFTSKHRALKRIRAYKGVENESSD